MELHSIGKESATKLYMSKWWERFTARQVAVFQLYTKELCCDWDAYSAAVRDALGKRAWTHQFTSNWASDMRKNLNATSLEYEEVKKAIMGQIHLY